MIVTLQKRGTITISHELRKKLGIEPGDPLELKIKGSSIVCTPVAVIPRTLKLTQKGLQKEIEAEDDIKQGRVKRFDTVEALVKDLEEE